MPIRIRHATRNKVLTHSIPHVSPLLRSALPGTVLVENFIGLAAGKTDIAYSTGTVNYHAVIFYAAEKAILAFQYQEGQAAQVDTFLGSPLQNPPPPKHSADKTGQCVPLLIDSGPS